MFLGKHPGALDGENRLTVPPAFSDQLAFGAYITQGFERNLVVLTAGAFQELYRKVRSLNMADPHSRLLSRMILGSARQIAIDADSRLSLPPELAAFAGLSGRAVLIGQGDYLEIWSPDAWQGQEIQLNDVEANAARFSMLTISTR